MVELTYKDAYSIVRTQTFDSKEDFVRALSGCMTLPDYLPVVSVTYKGKDVGYQGDCGNLFAYFVNFDWSTFD
ncbi:DUF4649 family protein [Streptococcus sp. zg-JUN1979]|uniref:DUF4649 family protein n=1 Tax=Streptococcus sp. zg-JUN1979 TaxID=3391450 RepID=UPI0039A4F7BF